MAAPRVGAILALSVFFACSHDWDAFDPRLGTTGGDGGGGAPSTAASGSGTSMTVSSSSETGSSTTGAGGAGGDGPGQVGYEAAIADCINPGAPDPDACALEVGQDRITVDTEFDEMTDPTPRQVYLRFEIGNELAGKTIDLAGVHLRVPSTSGSDSNQTGDMWLVAPFDRAALFVAAPATMGSRPISPDQGTVAQGELVVFPLPASAVVAGGTVYLGILPLSTNGVDYFNLAGEDPPVLVVDYH
jgi:hypothetical protein